MQLIACPPNYRFRKIKKNNIWILRDYYPETNIMFKMTAVHRTPEEIAQYRHHPPEWYSDSHGILYVNVKLAKSNISNKLHVPYNEAQNYLKEKSVNIILGDNHKPKPFIDKKVKKMRKMFPKGFYENRFNKRSPHIHDKATDNSKDVSADGSGEL